MIHATEASALYISQSRKDRHVATVMIMILHFVAARLHLSGHVATTPKDRDHSFNSGAHAWPCSHGAKSTDVMPLQCKTTSPPDKAFPRPRGSFSNEDHATYQYFVTLHLLEAIKGACKDRSRGATHEHTTLLDLVRAPVESHTHTHTLHSHLEIWKHLPLSPTCNPCHKHFGAR
jgi:hypothetical protein